jgi:hypothetical protein
MSDVSVAVAHWLAARLGDRTIRWAYNPRTSELNSLIRSQFVADLLETCAPFERAARRGDVCCEFGAALGLGGRRAKKLDVVIGAPEVESSGLLGAIDGPNPLRIARVREAWLALEVKLCMTAHGRAKTRLIQELSGSLEAVDRAPGDTAAFAVVVVNTAETFFSPLNRPGPNVHPAGAAESVIADLSNEFSVGREPGEFRGFALSLIEFDNDDTVEVVSTRGRIPHGREYEDVLAEAGRELRARLSAFPIHR